MPRIELLDQQTIDKIAAGEVVDRPSSVVKELIENAIDATADTITIEIRDGGTSLIRVTDNGCGIPEEEIAAAFLRHSTSKIRQAEDLLDIHSLGFRGEALSSISAVSQTELITKPADRMLGTRYRIDGGLPRDLEEIGAPNGTTILVKNLFYNVPARKKFLRTAQTEAGYVSALIEHLAMSHPGVSFRYINNGAMKLNTSGNGELKDVIYQIFGRETAANLIRLKKETDAVSIDGWIGTPALSRGNRTYENFFVNGRYIQSKLLSAALEEGCKGFLMQHRYPFAVLHLTVAGNRVDVNVHPGKMELRFSQPEQIYAALSETVQEALHQQSLIPRVAPGSEKAPAKQQKTKPESAPEPFEEARLQKLREAVRKDSPYEKKYPQYRQDDFILREQAAESRTTDAAGEAQAIESQAADMAGEAQAIESQAADMAGKAQAAEPAGAVKPEQLSFRSLVGEPQQTARSYQIIGQLFETYWLIESEDELFIVDQHAAHEKVLYERTMRAYRDRQFHTQQVRPPIVLTLSQQEYDLFLSCQDAFEKLGFETEPFGDQTIAIRGVPADLYGLNGKEVFLSLIDELDLISAKDTPEMVLDKVASMSCKAAVKGNSRLSEAEIRHLLDELMHLENPYFCPHGRPVIIAMPHAEIDRKFKRIL